MHRTLVAGLAVAATIAAGAGIVVVLTTGGDQAQRPAPTYTSSHAPARTEGAAEPAVLTKPYAGRTVTGYLTGYAAGAVTFRSATWIPGGLDGGHYAVGSATSALPLAAQPTVRSAVTICSAGQVTLDRTGNAAKPCTAGQLVATLRSGAHPYATMTVDAAGRITAVLERYVP